jgi:hypothetical protein
MSVGIVAGAISRPKKSHSIRCAGASFRIGARTRAEAATRSIPNVRPFVACQHSGMRIEAADPGTLPRRRRRVADRADGLLFAVRAYTPRLPTAE